MRLGRRSAAPLPGGHGRCLLLSAASLAGQARLANQVVVLRNCGWAPLTAPTPCMNVPIRLC